ncbi:MAG: DUF1553 domain-containing protein, partial [Bacteroidota bacterium]
PILSDRCWSCHGPDEETRQAGLRLDTEEGAFAQLASGARAFVPGKPGASEAIARMISDDPELVMPVPESKMTVSAKEIALIAKWVDQGAEWKEHWAFLPISAPAAAPNPIGYPAANSIDHFINERLRQEGLPANDRADNERLLRRLYLDLTGLPPSPEATDSWLANPSDEAYATIVDTLLTTDAHAERLTMEWLDLARYADSHGMHADGWRLAWPYRDWVIQAFKDNKPFDEFVREQVAGDLLPESKQEQLIASAFNRMHPMTAEGGVIGEEMRLTYVFDRVNTVATGLLGLTMDCSRCHDHKFDPLSQAEYYGFSAFFNNFNELGMTGDDGNYGPYILLSDQETRQQLSEFEEQLTALEQERAAVAINSEDLARFLAQEKVKPPQPDYQLPGDKIKKSKDGNGFRVDQYAWATGGFTLTEDTKRGKVLAFDHAFDDLFFDEPIGARTATEPFSVSLFLKTTKRDSTLTQTILGNAGAKNQAWQGSEFYLDEENRLNVRMIKIMPDDALHVRSLDSLKLNTWYQVAYTYDGSGTAAGLKIYVNGKSPDQQTVLDNLRGESYPLNHAKWMKVKARKLRVGQAYRNFTGENGIFLGWMDDLKLFNRSLTPLEVARLAQADVVVDQAVAKDHMRLTDPRYQQKLAEYRAVKAKQLAIQDTLQRLMVSEEMNRPRPTFVLDRGAYDAPREQVFPTTPKGVLPFPEDLPKDRLGLAQWMFLADNPLTARVAVNRYWQLIFGQGIVKTPHDFGSQGALPSHPALLDHLAISFRERGWDVRALIRQMVLSEAYRRNSTATEQQRETDPENALLARGPSYRLPAEMIRDNALAASGLLVAKVGGPSVRPYQPPGLWIQANNFSQMLLTYQADSGEKLYRRSMYTFIKRTAPPPFLTNFDATGRDVCLVKRSTTNTPLQALNLLNDPQFVETARVLAQRVQLEKESVEEQLALAFRLVAGRKAKEKEVAVLRDLFEEEFSRFQESPSAADSLLTVGEYPVLESLDPLKTAALASVGNVLFSFDEAYVKR